MAKCKMCKINIPDGTEYCNDCQDKKNSLNNETYLDSLLNSVKNTEPVTESIYKKKSPNSTPINTNNNLEHQVDIGSLMDRDEKEDYGSLESEEISLADPDLQELLSYKVDLSDIQDFEEFYMEEDMNDLQDSIEIGDDELFGNDIPDLLSGNTENEESVNLAEPVTEGESNQYIENDTNNAYKDDAQYMSEKEFQPDELIIPDETREEASIEEMNQELYYTDDNQEEIIEEDDIPDGRISENFIPNEIEEYNAEEDFDNDLNNLLNSLDTFHEDNQEDYMGGSDSGNEANTVETTMEFESAEYEETEQQDEDDYLSLLNQISEDDPVSGDMKAINDLLSGVPLSTQKAMPSDVGEVFSDALKVVTNLNDEDEFDLLQKTPESKKKKNKKNKKAAKKDEEGATEENPKINFFKRIFGNVKDENAVPKSKASLTGEEAATESLAPKASTKKVKSKKPKKGATTEEGAEEENDKKAKAAKAKELKKEKKENRKNAKEAIQVIDDIEEDEGRINRLGASIVFLFFGLMTALILIGTNMVSYTLSIQNATNYFEVKRYTAAYNEVYGMDIEDEDIEIYDKIMTVMFVNKQLNSYNGYYSLGMYPEALDSLLKGLRRYDKYIELATMLGIKTDLDYVRNQILAELDNEFQLTEKEAMKIISSEDMKKYSMEVYNVVLENMRN